ncbi:XrtY-associated glycosyltransferase XYAG1 [Mucilaginibacter boryungensis]|uniref:Glycosyltransferase n=1 Tax=Mucilaginibacter boryungensis TaxID=768480 RepID=A0ABR9XFL7_9SPHI|nr:glycosyltransferase [Mucilaginibacter boryungensis]MBE9665985.1 glycosyltransferase [Mucilaginibacter boryungensis]
MKILQVNASYKPAYIYGGPTMSVSKLSEVLGRMGNSVRVFTTTANGQTELPVHTRETVLVDGVQVNYFPRITKDHSHFSPGLLRAVWKQVKQFDVVHIHAWWNLVSVLTCLIAVIRKVPVVLSPRGTLSSYSFHNKNALVKRCIHSLLGKPLLNKCFVHVTSTHEAEAIAQLIRPRQIINIPNFIELGNTAYWDDSRNDDVLKLLFFSRIEEKKGLDILIRSLTNISVPYHLTIAGNGEADYIETLKQLGIQNGVSANMSWIGFQGENKFNIMAQADVLVLPSYDENFGNVVIESLSVGTAVLVSEHVGLAAYVAENNFGWICKTEPDSIAQTINRIDKGTLKAIRQRARQKILQDFNEAELAKQYISMYQQITHHG